MPITDLLGEIGGNSIRALARNLFSSFYERNLSANAALQELRNEGLGYRRQDFLNDFRVDKSSFDQASSIRYVNLDKVPSEGILEGKYHGVPDKYSLLFEYSGIDPVTGDEKSGYFFYHRNSLDTRSSMEDDALEYIHTTTGGSGFDASTVRVIEGFINPNYQ